MIRTLALAVLLALPFAAEAMLFDVAAGPFATEILATGPIEAGDLSRLRQLVDRLPATVPIAGLRISSPGGSVSEAEALAGAIRAAKLPVTVASDGVCASACFLIFAAAPDRRVGLAARVGVHGASIRGRESPAAMAITTDVARRAGAYGVPPEIIGKLVLTDPTQITWLTASDLLAMGVHPAR